MTVNARETEEKQISLADVEHEIVHHTELPRTTLSSFIDTWVGGLGALCSWLWIATIGTILTSVISRYVFSSGSVMLEEVQWHLAGAAWLVGLSYALVHDAHVRVDVLHERLSRRTQAWVEFAGILLLLMPFLIISFWEALPYVLSSFEQNEHSQAPNGLPWRWLIKAFLPGSMLLLILAAIARFFRVTALLFGFPRPINSDRGTLTQGK